MSSLRNKTTLAQKQMILRLLERGKKITALEALQPPIKCMRLSGRIYDLKKEGYNIQKEMIEVSEGTRVAQYSLIKKTA